METRHTIPSAVPENSAPTELLVGGMNCQNCVRHVTDAIQSVSGVRNATVSLENRNATVYWNSGAQPDVPAVIKAVKRAGFEAKERLPR